ncbi:MAG: thioesterase family protein [Acidimicrobiales bacterium]|nr:thioesterase family protein [Acidimicrobiales bacterium]
MVSASMVFSRAATFDAPVAIEVDVLRSGRTYSTVETRTTQHDKLCCIGLVLLDAGADDLMRHTAPMPDVPGPHNCPPLDFGVTGRDLRVVGGAYHRSPDDVGPPELYTWIRLRDLAEDQALHTAMLAQPVTAWTIAAGMRPHRGITEDQAHVTLSTGPMSVDMAFHDDADATGWLLYANTAVYAGRGQVQGQGLVFTENGMLVASYSLHAMVRGLTTDPSSVGGYSTAM